jgi:hypothetical protein
MYNFLYKKDKKLMGLVGLEKEKKIKNIHIIYYIQTPGYDNTEENNDNEMQLTNNLITNSTKFYNFLQQYIFPN